MAKYKLQKQGFIRDDNNNMCRVGLTTTVVEYGNSKFTDNNSSTYSWMTTARLNKRTTAVVDFGNNSKLEQTTTVVEFGRQQQGTEQTTTAIEFGRQ